MRDLARVTALTDRPSSAATCAAGSPSIANRRNASRWLVRTQAAQSSATSGRCDDRGRGPARGRLTVRFGEPVEEGIARVNPDNGLPELSLPMIPQHVHGDRPHHARNDPSLCRSNLGISRTMTRKTSWVRSADSSPSPGTRPSRAADERPVDLLQPEPIGIVGLRCPEPIKKADGSRVHGRSLMEVQPASPLHMDEP